MAKFRDAEGREWELRITVGLLPKLREVGLNAARATEAFETVLKEGDPEKIGQWLWALCEEQAAKIGLAPESFAAGMDGPALFAAADAIAEALTDFSQRPTVAAKFKAKLSAVKTGAEAEAIRAVEAMSFGSNDSAGNSPDSPASTPPA